MYKNKFTDKTVPTVKKKNVWVTFKIKRVKNYLKNTQKSDIFFSIWLPCQGYFLNLGLGKCISIPVRLK